MPLPLRLWPPAPGAPALLPGAQRAAVRRERPAALRERLAADRQAQEDRQAQAARPAVQWVREQALRAAASSAAPP